MVTEIMGEQKNLLDCGSEILYFLTFLLLIINKPQGKRFASQQLLQLEGEICFIPFPIPQTLHLRLYKLYK